MEFEAGALAADERVAGVDFANSSRVVSLKDGRTIAVRLSGFRAS
jgi:hypothetical protein